MLFFRQKINPRKPGCVTTVDWLGVVVFTRPCKCMPNRRVYSCKAVELFTLTRKPDRRVCLRKAVELFTLTRRVHKSQVAYTTWFALYLDGSTRVCHVSTCTGRNSFKASTARDRFAVSLLPNLKRSRQPTERELCTCGALSSYHWV